MIFSLLNGVNPLGSLEMRIPVDALSKLTLNSNTLTSIRLGKSAPYRAVLSSAGK